MTVSEELAEWVQQMTGVPLHRELEAHWGGQQIYVSKPKTHRDNEIRQAHDGTPGCYRKLAIQYGLSERRIREIVHGR